MRLTCSRCGATQGATPYTWPGRCGVVEVLCSPCVSPLCEHCGQNEAALSVGTGARNFHLCSGCRDDAPYRRLRRVVRLRRPA